MDLVPGPAWADLLLGYRGISLVAGSVGAGLDPGSL